MRIVTLFATKGGVGRSAVTMALAAAYLRQGRRVSLLDASGGPSNWKEGSPLRQWRSHVLAHRQGDLPLTVIPARDVSDLLVALDHVTDQAAQDVARGIDTSLDMVLIDTAHPTDDRAHVALRATDLVLAPFRSSMDASSISEGLRHYLPAGIPVLALRNGFRDDDADRARARAAYDLGPIAQAELLDTPLLLSWLWDGWLPPSPPNWCTRRATRNVPLQPEIESTAWLAWSRISDLANEVWIAMTHLAQPNRSSAHRQALRLMRPPAPPATNLGI